MPDSPGPTPPPPPDPLNYRSPQPDPHPFHVLANTAKVTIGAVIGFAALLFVGMLSTGLARSTGEFSFHSAPLGIAYILAAIAAVGGCVLGLLHPPRKWFLAGLLTGAALACLLDGACFLSA